MGADSESAGLATTSITSDVVLRELKELRQYRGITMFRVRERAPQVQRLAATRDEAGRRQLAPEDHYIAGYYAIRCAVEHAIRRPDMAHILRRTMNFAEEGNFLDDRRASLIAEFDSRAKLYVRLETEAYVQLAGVLVAAERSPCRDEGKMPDSLSLDIKLTLERQDDVRWLLTLLTVDKRHAVQDAISSLILDRLPRGRLAVYGLPQEQRPLDDFEAGRYLIGLALLRLRDRGALDETTLSFSATSNLLLSKLLDVSWTATLAARQEGQPGLVFVNGDSRGGLWPNVDFYVRKAQVLGVVADYMLRAEISNDWDLELSRADTSMLVAMVS